MGCECTDAHSARILADITVFENRKAVAFDRGRLTEPAALGNGAATVGLYN